MNQSSDHGLSQYENLHSPKTGAGMLMTVRAGKPKPAPAPRHGTAGAGETYSQQRKNGQPFW